MFRPFPDLQGVASPDNSKNFCFKFKKIEQKFDIKIICFIFVTELLNMY